MKLQKPHRAYSVDNVYPEKIMGGPVNFDSIQSYERARMSWWKNRMREKANSEEKVYEIEGVKVNRYEMMEYIVEMVYQGLSLPQILNMNRDTSIMPTPREISQWFKIHTKFKDDYTNAELYRAELYNDMSVSAVMGAKKYSVDENGKKVEINPTRDEVAYVKLLKETLAEQASFLSEKFQPKSKQQIEDVTDRLSQEEAKKKYQELIKNDPDLIKITDNIKGELSDTQSQDAEIV